MRHWPASFAPAWLDLSGFKRGAMLRGLGIVWSGLLIALMASGAATTAHVGQMTWGPEHDIDAAAIAISHIRFGVTGGLALPQVEQAIVNETVSTKNIWSVHDAATKRLLENPANITRGFAAAAALAPGTIAWPAGNAGYVTDWCEDVGYADFYELAFRLFGFNAFSTHFLYMSLLSLSALLFALAFYRDSRAVGALVLAVSALFLLANTSIFSSWVPSFAANRFLSTLALIPLLHVLHTALRRFRPGWVEMALLALQCVILMWAIAFRLSAEWTLFAVYLSAAAIAVLRWHEVGRVAGAGGRLAAAAARILRIPGLGRLGLVAAIVFAITAGGGAWRLAQLDERYFWDDNYPYHLTWHNAYLGLTENNDWAGYKPYPELSNNVADDSIGYIVFERHMQAIGQPVQSTNGDLYGKYYLRARVYEPFIRGEYFRFLFDHPSFAAKLFLLDKPRRIAEQLIGEIRSIRIDPRIGAANPRFGWIVAGLVLSLLLAAALFAAPEGSNEGSRTGWRETAAAYVLSWACSLLPVMLTYSVFYAMSDQIWATLFVLLAGGGGAAAAAARLQRGLRPTRRAAIDRQ